MWTIQVKALDLQAAWNFHCCHVGTWLLQLENHHYIMYIYIYIYIYTIHNIYIYNTYIYTFHMISPASSWLPLPTRRLVNLISCCSFLLTKIPFFVGEMFGQFSRLRPTIKPNSSLEPFKTFNTRNSWARLVDLPKFKWYQILSWHPEILQYTNRQPRGGTSNVLSQWPNCSSECTKAVWDVHLQWCCWAADGSVDIAALHPPYAPHAPYGLWDQSLGPKMALCTYHDRCICGFQWVSNFEPCPYEGVKYTQVVGLNHVIVGDIPTTFYQIKLHISVVG